MTEIDVIKVYKVIIGEQEVVLTWFELQKLKSLIEHVLEKEKTLP